MRLSWNLVAWLLLALWLPATLHCGFEIASLVDEHRSPEANVSCCVADYPCAASGCAVVEGLFTKSANGRAKVLMPILLVCACLICWQRSLSAPRREPILMRAAFERPLDWVPVWQFVRRAAPLPRAPSFAV